MMNSNTSETKLLELEDKLLENSHTNFDTNNVFNIISYSNDRHYLRYLFTTACYENNHEIIKHFFEQCKILNDLALNACNFRCISECLDKYDRTSPIFKMTIYNKKKMFDPPNVENHYYTPFMLACYTDANKTLELLLDYYFKNYNDIYYDILSYKNNILFKICMMCNSFECCKLIYNKMLETFNETKNYEYDIFIKSFIVGANKTIEFYLETIYTPDDDTMVDILLNACRNKNNYVFSRFTHICTKENVGLCLLKAFSIRNNEDIIEKLCDYVVRFGYSPGKFQRTLEPSLMFDNHKMFISKNYNINDIIMTIISEYITSRVNYFTSYRDIKILIECALSKNSIFDLLCLIVGNVFIGKYSYIENFPYCLGVDSNVAKFVSYVISTYDCLPEYYFASSLVESFIDQKSSNLHINDFLRYCEEYKKLEKSELKDNDNNELELKDNNNELEIETPTKQLRTHLLSSNLICQYIVSKKHYRYLKKIVSNREIEHFKKHVDAVRDACENYDVYDHLVYEILGY